MGGENNSQGRNYVQEEGGCGPPSQIFFKY